MMPIAKPADDRSRYAAHAAEDDCRQPLEQRQIAHLRKNQEQRTNQRAAKRGERAAGGESELVDPVGVDADDAGGFRILAGRAQRRAERACIAERFAAPRSRPRKRR